MRAEFDPGQLLADWFAGTREDPQLIPARNAWWFGADADRDSLLAKRWGQDCADAASGSWGGLDAEPPGRLALVLLLDQLPRNLYRGTPQAFATDSLALDLCLNGHDRGMGQRLSLIERVFFWMPLQHVEDLELQDLGVRLYESLAGDDPEQAELWRGFARFAHLHNDIIAKFGRFPHRNEILGRESTDAELAWLAEGGVRFGQ
jgi:uncharacterized protein (DUF924 family)